MSDALMQKVVALATKRGRVARLSFDNSNYGMADEADGTGSYIRAWSVAELGPLPTLEDGFTESELRRVQELELITQPTRPPSVDELRDEALLADVDRRAIVQAIRNATPAQIKTYINNNVTDLASARAMLRNLALLVALLVRR